MPIKVENVGGEVSMLTSRFELEQEIERQFAAGNIAKDESEPPLDVEMRGDDR